ncbi:MAG: Hint domain-containing protein [Rhodobacteraceae bacterium]|nr:Hint domain-containing protein [Paracoccaceae bacterium]
MLQHLLSTPQPPVLAGQRARPTGLVAGTLVRTADGDIPVEFLLAGDRIETRGNGPVELRGTSVIEARDIDLVTIDRGAQETGHRHSARALQVPACQQVMVRDWRAVLIQGTDEMLTPASSLVDDLLVTRQRHASVRLIRLHFDAPQVFWADGIEVASARLRAPSATRTRRLLH